MQITKELIEQVKVYEGLSDKSRSYKQALGTYGTINTFLNKDKTARLLEYYGQIIEGIQFPVDISVEQEIQEIIKYYEENHFKLSGRFYIRLKDPVKILDDSGKEHVYLYCTQTNESNRLYIWFNGCSGPQPERNANLILSADGYNTRREAEEAIEKFQIPGEVEFYQGCGCCGFAYEDTINQTISYLSTYPDTKSSFEAFVHYLDVCYSKLESHQSFTEHNFDFEESQRYYKQFKNNQFDKKVLELDKEPLKIDYLQSQSSLAQVIDKINEVVRRVNILTILSTSIQDSPSRILNKIKDLDKKEEN